MKVLLVNTNRYKSPPVIPIGIEYLSTYLIEAGHDIDILDLCFSSTPKAELQNRIVTYNPDVIGLSIRQIDTVLYRNNECFLDEITDFVLRCKDAGKPVILGGAGFSSMPEELLDHTGADFGILGPGEIAIILLLKELEKGAPSSHLYDGFHAGIHPGFRHIRGKDFDYSTYIARGGIVGFQTQAGCTENCLYCPESAKKVIFREPLTIAQEVKEIQCAGYSHFHLCDSEFNLDIDHCIAVCRELASLTPGIEWTIYMKPEPFTEELFNGLKRAGVYLITLTLDTKPEKPYSRKRLSEFFHLAERYEIKIVVDLLTGFPHEDPEAARDFFDFIKEQPLSSVGVNNYFRIFPQTRLRKIIENDRELHQYLVNYKVGSNYLYPVFFNYFSDDLVVDLIGDSQVMKLEGFDKSSNYQRLMDSE